MGSSNEPDPISWATAPPDPPTYIVEPSAGDKANGFDPLDTPPFSWVNWAWNRLSSWVTYLATFMTANSDAYVLTGMGCTEVPNATQVQVAVGTAIAGGRQVEVTGTETITMPAAAGLGSSANPRVYTVYIDNTGTIAVSTTLDGDGIEQTLYIAKLYARRIIQPANAVIAYVVDQGQATFDTANIYNDKQTAPISNAVVADGMIESRSLAAAVTRTKLGSADTSTAQRVEIPLELAAFEKDGSFGIYGTPQFRAGDVNLWIRVREYTATTTALGPDGYSFRAMGASFVGDIGVAVRRAADAAGTAIVPTALSPQQGALGYWAGAVDPYDADDPDDDKDFVIELHRAPGQAAKTVFLEVGSDHGVTTSKPFSLPST